MTSIGTQEATSLDEQVVLRLGWERTGAVVWRGPLHEWLDTHDAAPEASEECDVLRTLDDGGQWRIGGAGRRGKLSLWRADRCTATPPIRVLGGQP